MYIGSNLLDVREFGAVSDSGEKCTRALQAAFDQANLNRPSTVIFPKGEYVSGTVNIGNASIYLENGAVWKGSPDIEDYSFCGYHHNEMGRVFPLIYSMNSDGITISGEGTIDLNGDAFFDFVRPDIPRTTMKLSQNQLNECTVPFQRRPNQPIFFRNCSDIVVKGIRILNAPCWTFSFSSCTRIRMSDLVIENDLRIPNNDGMHFCGCSDVQIRGCMISAGDDCIAVSGITDWERPCENITISDCILMSCSKAIVLGYQHSVVRNVCISNVIIRNSNRGICIMSSERTGLVENVTVSNVRIDTRVRAGRWWGNGEPILIMATRHHDERCVIPEPQRNWDVNVQDIRIMNVICSAENAIGIIGVAKNIRGVSVQGLTLRMKQSENLGVKGKVLDLSPSQQIETIPQDDADYWLVLQEVKDVVFKDILIHPFAGSVLKASIERSEDARIMM